ncbi:MAG: isopentenyl phosphate kinase family protein [Candidatus Methanomethylophilaceae archaeon]|nr:isopentenyl phosphate kinase family protein [Candidatus Methanomethylophilaceae archaeon]
MILIKLGGSVITDKREYRRFNRDIVARLCSEIKESGKEVIVVHGAGSFGHVLAKKHSLNSGFVNEDQIPAVAQVCYDVRELNSMIIKELNDAGIPSISMPPGSCFMMCDRTISLEGGDVIRSMVDKGLMPVLFGDVVQDKELGFAICSGDQIMERLSEIYDFERIIFVSDIDGLFDDDPKDNPNAKLFEYVNIDTLESVRAGSTVDDVTGGVYEKMMSMLRMTSSDRECVLINGTVPGRLLSALRGEDVICTTAKGGIQ